MGAMGRLYLRWEIATTRTTIEIGIPDVGYDGDSDLKCSNMQ